MKNKLKQTKQQQNNKTAFTMEPREGDWLVLTHSHSSGSTPQEAITGEFR